MRVNLTLTLRPRRDPAPVPCNTHTHTGKASDGVLYAGARSSVGRRFRSVTKLRFEWYGGSFLIAAAALKTPTRSDYNARGVNLTIHVFLCQSHKNTTNNVFRHVDPV